MSQLRHSSRLLRSCRDRPQPTLTLTLMELASAPLRRKNPHGRPPWQVRLHNGPCCLNPCPARLAQNLGLAAAPWTRCGCDLDQGVQVNSYISRLGLIMHLVKGLRRDIRSRFFLHFWLCWMSHTSVARPPRSKPHPTRQNPAILKALPVVRSP